MNRKTSNISGQLSDFSFSFQYQKNVEKKALYAHTSSQVYFEQPVQSVFVWKGGDVRTYIDILCGSRSLVKQT